MNGILAVVVIVAFVLVVGLAFLGGALWYAVGAAEIADKQRREQENG